MYTGGSCPSKVDWSGIAVSPPALTFLQPGIPGRGSTFNDRVIMWYHWSREMPYPYLWLHHLETQLEVQPILNIRGDQDSKSLSKTVIAWSRALPATAPISGSWNEIRPGTWLSASFWSWRSCGVSLQWEWKTLDHFSKSVRRLFTGWYSFFKGGKSWSCTHFFPGKSFSSETLEFKHLSSVDLVQGYGTWASLDGDGHVRYHKCQIKKSNPIDSHVYHRCSVFVSTRHHWTIWLQSRSGTVRWEEFKQPLLFITGGKIFSNQAHKSQILRKVQIGHLPNSPIECAM